MTAPLLGELTLRESFWGKYGFFASLRMTLVCHCEHTAGMLGNPFSPFGTVKTVPYRNAQKQPGNFAILKTVADPERRRSEFRNAVFPVVRFVPL